MSTSSDVVPRNLFPAHIEDVDAMAMLEQACFSYDQISAAKFKQFLTSGRAAAWLLKVGTVAVGYGLVLFHKGQKAARIYGIAIHPDFRGQGLSKPLMEAMENAARARGMKSIRLEVKVDNAPARSLYEKYGYETVSRLPAYYDDGLDAWRMKKRFK